MTHRYELRQTEPTQSRHIYRDGDYFGSAARQEYAEQIVSALNTGPELLAENAELKVEVGRLHALLNTPEIESFDKAVPLEAAHQQERWDAQHDAGKNPEDWFWLIGYLAGKALHSMKTGNRDKALHHTISTAAALRNWHAHIRSGETAMRPGIGEPNV